MLAAMARVGWSGPADVDGTVEGMQKRRGAYRPTIAHAKRDTEAFRSSVRSAFKDLIINIRWLYALVFALERIPNEGIQKGWYEVAGIGALLRVIVTAVRRIFPISKTAVPGACVGGDFMDAGGSLVSGDECETSAGKRPLFWQRAADIIRRGVHNIIAAHGGLQPMTGENRQEFFGVIAHGFRRIAFESRTLIEAVIQRSEDSRCKWQAENFQGLHTRVVATIAVIKSCSQPGVRAAPPCCKRACVKVRTTSQGLLVLCAVGFIMIDSAYARDQLTETYCKPKDSTVWETSGNFVKAAAAVLLGVAGGWAAGAWTMPFPFTVRDVNRVLASGPPVFKKSDSIVALPPQIFE